MDSGSEQCAVNAIYVDGQSHGREESDLVMKTRYLESVFVLAVLLGSLMIPVFAAQNLNPNKLYGAPRYVLNIIGKKDGWSGGGSYDNPDRHTMFVPQSAENITIWMTQGSDWAVLDGNAFDDGQCNFTFGPGKYAVFLVALGKPGGGGNIEGWIYNATDNTYILLVGTVSLQGHSKTPRWENATDLFWVSPGEDLYGLVTDETWIFDYLAMLEAYNQYGEYLYLWLLDNNNNKLIQVRFYQIG